MDSEAIAIAKSQTTPIPNVLLGSSELIRRLSEEEAILEGKIDKTEFHSKKSYYTDPIETLSSLVIKYGNKDLYKDVYKFIKI